jgi:hypothetical protein
MVGLLEQERERVRGPLRDPERHPRRHIAELDDVEQLMRDREPDSVAVEAPRTAARLISKTGREFEERAPGAAGRWHRAAEGPPRPSQVDVKSGVRPSGIGKGRLESRKGAALEGRFREEGECGFSGIADLFDVVGHAVRRRIVATRWGVRPGGRVVDNHARAGERPCGAGV